MFGDIEHGDAAALGGGEIVHGGGPYFSIPSKQAYETGFSERQKLLVRQALAHQSFIQNCNQTDKRSINLSDMTVEKAVFSAFNLLQQEPETVLNIFKRRQICRYRAVTKTLKAFCLPTPLQ
jgi:hypothetical protein